MKNTSTFKYGAATAVAALLSAGIASADSISPTSFTADLAVGEFETVRKTVVIDDAPPTDALIDIMFLIDTTGSMSGEIAAAKLAADDILAGLETFSTSPVASGLGWFNDTICFTGSGLCDGSSEIKGFEGVDADLDTTPGATSAALAAYDIFYPEGGGGADGLELGYDAILDAASDAYDGDDASWRPGSSRFIVALGDIGWKLDDAGSAGCGTGFYPDSSCVPDRATVEAALDDAGISLIGLDFGSGGLSSDVTAVGGTAYASTTDPDDIVADILAGVGSSFEEYTTVTVDDLGGGLPEILVETTCVSAAAGGACVGSDAVGVYDRSIERTFTFDVKFTRVADGDSAFDTFALVDGKRVATEADRFPDAVIPLPAGVWLMLGGLGALAGLRRRQKKAA